jgi:septal ring factor EnvC (AmiA/AmiB activator)
MEVPENVSREKQLPVALDCRDAPGRIRGKRVMTEQEFQTKLAELMGEITTLPQAERKKLEKLASETRERHERLRATVSTLQESLDYLRLSIKYLVFDLEATRRENGYLRKMLEETTGNEGSI